VRDRPLVLVLMGGPDAERRVSIHSGQAVAKALGESGRHEVIEQIIDRPSADELAAHECDVIFPVLHGRWGEGGPLQEELEQLGRPYVGSGPEASALAMDKLRTKTLLARDGVATPAAIELAPQDPCRLEPPVVIKPVDDGSSVDIRICHTRDELDAARSDLHPRQARLMAEVYVPGRELTVGVVNGRLLPVIEVRPTVDFYDYEAKYDRDDTEYVASPELPGDVERLCRDWSERAWACIGCRDIARMDYRLDRQDRLWFLEVNTMPGFTDHSLVPMAARFEGVEMPELCASLVDAALDRGRPVSQAELTH